MKNTLVNLVSKQIAPNYLAIRHVNPDNIILCFTKESKEEKKLLNDVLRERGFTNIKNIEINPFDLERNRTLAADIFSDKDTDFILNYTGGTKQMSIPFYDICLTREIPALYVDTQNESIWWTKSGTYIKEKFNFKIDVSEYFLLSGHSIEVRGDVNSIRQRSALTRWLFDRHVKNHSSLRKLRKLLSAANKCLGNNIPWNGGMVKDLIEVRIEKKNAVIKYYRNHDEMKLEIPADQHTGYFSGGWFEEFVYLELLESGYFDDVKCRLVIYPLNPVKPLDVEGELDVVCLKNGIPYFIECKSGNVKQDDINKMETMARIFGGKYTMQVLAALWTPKAQLERIEHLSIKLVSTPGKIMNIVPILKGIQKARK